MITIVESNLYTWSHGLVLYIITIRKILCKQPSPTDAKFEPEIPYITVKMMYYLIFMTQHRQRCRHSSFHYLRVLRPFFFLHIWHQWVILAQFNKCSFFYCIQNLTKTPRVHFFGEATRFHTLRCSQIEDFALPVHLQPHFQLLVSCSVLCYYQWQIQAEMVQRSELVMIEKQNQIDLYSVT